MTVADSHPHFVNPQQANQTLTAMLRQCLPGQSWSQVRKLIAAGRVKINGEPWLDPARRLKAGDTVEILDRPLTKPRLIDNIVIRHIDTHVIVVEKPAGISTVRHPAERDWSDARRELVPTLDDLVLRQIGLPPHKKGSGPRPRLRIVQRLDKDTSGLVVFARTVDAERGLGRQFKRHTVTRRYLAVVPGFVRPQPIRSFLVRDRGDGRRGSTPVSGLGKEALTHIDVVERLRGYTVLSCRLETGRTHQIRIHLAELGHPVCGERVYDHPLGRPPREDKSGAPRLALHAAELGFLHPVSGEPMRWEMPLPPDLRDWLDCLRKKTEQSMIEIKWTDADPETGGRRFLCADKFAKEWRFRWKPQRRGPWTRGLEPTLAMWEHVLDSLKRRYRRREGVSDEDIEQVSAIVADMRRKRDESA